MQFRKTVNIWSLTECQIRQLQPGQWIRAGGMLGRFVGITRRGVVSVTYPKGMGGLGPVKSSLFTAMRATFKARNG